MVDAVLPSLIARYPCPEAMASANAEELSRLLRPLGLNRVRATALIEVARRICEEHRGRIPDDERALLNLPHVGRYTANAVLCFAYGHDVPVVDANVARVLSRLYRVPRPVEIHRADWLWDLAARLVPPGHAREFNWALLDLAGLVCLPRSPRCWDCPLSELCSFRRQALTRSAGGE